MMQGPMKQLQNFGDQLSSHHRRSIVYRCATMREGRAEGSLDSVKDFTWGRAVTLARKKTILAHWFFIPKNQLLVNRSKNLYIASSRLTSYEDVSLGTPTPQRACIIQQSSDDSQAFHFIANKIDSNCIVTNKGRQTVSPFFIVFQLPAKINVSTSVVGIMWSCPSANTSLQVTALNGFGPSPPTICSANGSAFCWSNAWTNP